MACVLIVKVPPRIQDLARSQAKERTHASLKYIEASTIIVVDDVDKDLSLLVNLRNFVALNCIARLCSVKRGGMLQEVEG